MAVARLGARRVGADRAVGAVAAARRTLGSAALDVGVHFGNDDRVTLVLLVFERPLLLRAVNLTEVVDAGVFWAVWRAFTKLGIAIAARRPMMATTIMISTSVKPAFLLVLVFMLFCLSDSWRERN